MNIVVCIKQVPDTAAKVIVQENGTLSWGDAPLVLNPWDEYAVEAALVQSETHGGQVHALSMDNTDSHEALKHVLAMGCKTATLISDPALEDADSQVTAQVLAAAIKKIGNVDLIVFGKQAVDGDSGILAAQTARVLGWPLLSLATSIQITQDKIQIERTIEEGLQILQSKLPAVISVVKDIGEPRYPSFMGIRKASRAKIPIWSLADLGIEISDSVVEYLALLNIPSQEVSCEFISGDTPEEMATNLVDKLFSEKVL